MNITSDASTIINAPADKVWQAITNPEIVKQWFFGTTVESSWQPGESIVFRGEWNGQAYEDKGTIKQIEPNKVLEYTHLSSRTGQADEPENYEIVRFELTETNNQTTMHIHEENLASIEARDKSIELWKIVLSNLKKTVEG
ncbi:MAG TPA: SRPBCC family protein [Candidatus Saccharimonadales bacterium]|nr:SRPBCC family protein [Candidatus Saccharimonadales bacterium]